MKAIWSMIEMEFILLTMGEGTSVDLNCLVPYWESGRSQFSLRSGETRGSGRSRDSLLTFGPSAADRATGTFGARRTFTRIGQRLEVRDNTHLNLTL